jgi:oxygen-independent coproporphyrinogen-3 oxidase
VPENMVETEYLSRNQRYNEYVMTSLRTTWGCDSEHIRNVFGEERQKCFLLMVEKHVRNNMVRADGNIFYLTDEGKLFADGVASALFADDADN